MKVLLVSQEVPPETGWGGIGTYVGIIAPALARVGAQVHVLSVVRLQRRSIARRSDGVQVHRAPLVRPPGVGRLSRLPHTWQRVSLAFAVAREYRRLGMAFDVVECPEWMAEGLVLAHRREVPLVVRLHASAAQVFPYVGRSGVDRRIAIRLEEHVVRRAEIVTGTGAQVHSVGRRLDLPGGALREITYPVAPAAVTPLPAGSPRICFAGRFEQRKGPDTLIRALPKVRASLPGTRLVLVGRDCSDGGHASRKAWLLRLAADLGVAHAVEVIERWGIDAVAEEVTRSHACAVPSYFESFGYVAAEAAALGRPVVASRIHALNDVVVDGVTGRLAPPGDADAWADALIDVLADRDRASALGRAAAEYVARRCDPDRVARLTLDAYKDAIERFRRGPSGRRAALSRWRAGRMVSR